jgi:branched-chain amino acid transport system permease protein
MAISVLVNGILLGGVYTLLTIPLTLIFGVLGFIHLAHGDFIMVGAYLTFWLFNMSGMDPFYSLGLTIILLLMIGLFLKRSLINPVLKAPVINQLLLSFGIAITLQSLVLLLFTGDYISIKTWYSSKSISFGPVSISFTRFMGFLIACFFTGLLMLGLKKTEWGRVLRAVAQNEEAALLIGARPAQAYTIAFSVAFILAAVAGMITTLTMYSYPTIGFTFSVKAFSVAVLGGLGSVPGAIAASMLIGITESCIGTYITGGASMSEGVSFLVLILVLAFMPRGLMGKQTS